MGSKTFGRITGASRAKFHDLRIMKSTPYIAFALLCKNYFKQSFPFLRNWPLHDHKQILSELYIKKRNRLSLLHGIDMTQAF